MIVETERAFFLVNGGCGRGRNETGSGDVGTGHGGYRSGDGGSSGGITVDDNNSLLIDNAWRQLMMFDRQRWQPKLEN